MPDKKVDKKLDKKEKPKVKEIEIVHQGPIYICESCHVLLKVPDEKLEEETLKDEDDDGEFEVLNTFYMCPKCSFKNIVSEEELVESSDDD